MDKNTICRLMVSSDKIVVVRYGKRPAIVIRNEYRYISYYSKVRFEMALKKYAPYQVQLYPKMLLVYDI